MEEDRIPKINLVVALQCTSKAICGRQLPWHSVKHIFEYACGLDSKEFHVRGSAKIVSQISTLKFEKHAELYLAV
jgi:hypothetical protein